MVKGAQKRMVVVKTADSDMFEEAYFVIRRNAGHRSMDMLAEANRIIEGCGIGKREKRKIDLRLLLFCLASFMSGGFLGAFCVALTALVS